MNFESFKNNFDPVIFGHSFRNLGVIAQKLAQTSSTPTEAAAKFQKVIDFLIKAVEVGAEFTEAAAPIAEMIGLAMGNPAVVAGAKMAGTIATGVDAAIDAKKDEPNP